MCTTRRSSRHGGGGSPPPRPDPTQIPPWVWAWTRSPSTSPLDVGLDQIHLNFPLGCGPGPDPPQLPPWVWAWRPPTPPGEGAGLPETSAPPQDQATLPCEQNSWHTLVKILPCPKLRLRAVTTSWSLSYCYSPDSHADFTEMLNHWVYFITAE